MQAGKRLLEEPILEALNPDLNVKINEVFSPLFFIVFILLLLQYG